MSAKATVLLFIPAAFCAFISMMAAFRGDNAMPAFFAFLPMCFVFAAMPVLVMNKRLTDLEEKLKQADEENS
jgi:hypothetical protein